MNEKEIYEKPEIIVVEFKIEDSIAVSGNGAIGGESIWTPSGE
jgi:hypothetical protein